MRSTFAAAALALLLQGCGWYFLERDPNEVPRGAVAPAFALDSHQGGRVALDDLRAQGHVVLVFYRGHWWLFCRDQLGELNEQREAFTRAGAILAGISGDTVAESQAWQADEDPEDRLAFPLLADPALEACKAYGLFDARNGFTLPGVVIVHRGDGKVGYVRPSDSIADRPSIEDVLEAVRALPAEGPE